jgi:hypothetical protein
MPVPMKASIPLNVDIADGYIIRFTAISPTTGAVVPNVIVSDVSVLADVPEGDGTIVAPATPGRSYFVGE